jgi:peptidyl-prolyl cis-trans isomerase B (cyclophilin B)
MKFATALLAAGLVTNGLCADDASSVTSGKKDNNPVVCMQTNMGSIVIELYPKKAPITVKNFLRYVKGGLYKGTIFHRVINRFMIQGGGFTEDYKKVKTFDPIKNEADNGLKNEIGTIAMARTSDPNSATDQFFINTADNTFLNYTAPDRNGWGYAVFGKVVKGMDVVDSIGKLKTGSAGPFNSDVPIKPVVIENMYVE